MQFTEKNNFFHFLTMMSPLCAVPWSFFRCRGSAIFFFRYQRNIQAFSNLDLVILFFDMRLICSLNRG